MSYKKREYTVHITQDQTNTIIECYTDFGFSINKISKYIGVGWRIVERVLKDNNISLHGTRESKLKYHIDDMYFKTIDTEEKAYWLGFIAADGCVRSDEKTFSIALAEKDKSHLDKLSIALSSDYPIYKTTKILNGKEFRGVKIQVTNPTLCSTLIQHGITPRKSASLEFPIISINLERHFVRGLFDGDGSVCGDGSAPIFSICGTYMVLERIKDIVAPSSNAKLYARNYGMDTFRTLSIGGRSQVAMIHGILYDDATIYLDRKKNVFDRVIVKPERASFLNEGYESLKRRCVCTTTGKQYASLTEAARDHCLSSSGISQCCKHKRTYCGTLNGIPLRWEYADNYESNIAYDIGNFYKHTIAVYCISTNEHFNSIKDACQKHPSANSAGISNTCKGKQYYSGIDATSDSVLVWMFYDDYEKISDNDITSMIDIANKVASREHQHSAVRCVTTGEEFASLRIAADKYGVDSASICHCCKGRRKTTGVHPDSGAKLCWEYAN